VDGDKNRPESGPPEVRARQMGTKADPWRDGNGPAEEGPERPEADWQEDIRTGQRPQGTSRHDAGHRDQAVSGEDASNLRDLGYRPSGNQVRHEPMPASHHAGDPQDQPDRQAPEQCGEPGSGNGERRRSRRRIRRRGPLRRGGGAAEPPAW
jgi:hypothetical protein